MARIHPNGDFEDYEVIEVDERNAVRVAELNGKWYWGYEIRCSVLTEVKECCMLDEHLESRWKALATGLLEMSKRVRLANLFFVRNNDPEDPYYKEGGQIKVLDLISKIDDVYLKKVINELTDELPFE